MQVDWKLASCKYHYGQANLRDENAVQEPKKEDNRPKRRHIFLRIDSWIDSTGWNAGFRLGEWWEDTTIFFRRFRVRGWKRAVFELLGEAAT